MRDFYGNDAGQRRTNRRPGWFVAARSAAIRRRAGSGCQRQNARRVKTQLSSSPPKSSSLPIPASKSEFRCCYPRGTDYRPDGTDRLRRGQFLRLVKVRLRFSSIILTISCGCEPLNILSACCPAPRRLPPAAVCSAPAIKPPPRALPAAHSFTAAFAAHTAVARWPEGGHIVRPGNGVGAAALAAAKQAGEEPAAARFCRL